MSSKQVSSRPTSLYMAVSILLAATASLLTADEVINPPPLSVAASPAEQPSETMPTELLPTLEALAKAVQCQPGEPMYVGLLQGQGLTTPAHDPSRSTTGRSVAAEKLSLAERIRLVLSPSRPISRQTPARPVHDVPSSRAVAAEAAPSVKLADRRATVQIDQPPADQPPLAPPPTVSTANADDTVTVNPLRGAAQTKPAESSMPAEGPLDSASWSFAKDRQPQSHNPLRPDSTAPRRQPLLSEANPLRSSSTRR